MSTWAPKVGKIIAQNQQKNSPKGDNFPVTRSLRGVVPWGIGVLVLGSVSDY